MNWYFSVLQKYAVFKGRARRKEYWMFTLFNTIFAIIAVILDNICGTTLNSDYGVIYLLYCLAVLLPSLGVSVRRLHDVNKSGWFLLVALIPLIGVIWLLVLMCIDGGINDNKYGANPKGNAGTYLDNITGSNLSAVEQMKRLAELRDNGILTDEEFALKKQELLLKM